MPNPIDIPIGRVELLGQVLHIIEHDGQLVAACTDESGEVVTILTSRDVNARACHSLMQAAVDALFSSALADSPCPERVVRRPSPFLPTIRLPKNRRRR